MMTDRKKNILFVVRAYSFMWIPSLLLAVLIVTGIFPREGTPLQILISLGSWAPTIAVLV